MSAVYMHIIFSSFSKLALVYKHISPNHLTFITSIYFYNMTFT